MYHIFCWKLDILDDICNNSGFWYFSVACLNVICRIYLPCSPLSCWIFVFCLILIFMLWTWLRRGCLLASQWLSRGCSQKSWTHKVSVLCQVICVCVSRRTFKVQPVLKLALALTFHWGLSGLPSTCTYFANQQEMCRELPWHFDVSLPGSPYHIFGWSVTHPNWDCNLGLAELWLFPHSVPYRVCYFYWQWHWAGALPSAPNQVSLLWQPWPGKTILLAS